MVGKQARAGTVSVGKLTTSPAWAAAINSLKLTKGMGVELTQEPYNFNF
jgi:hypothetical protein